MNYLVNFITLLREIDKIIQAEKTGVNNEFARQLNISVYKLRLYLFILKELFKAPIEFDKKKNSYYYSEKGKIHLYFQYS